MEANAALSQLLEATGVGYWEYDHLADRVSFSNKLRDWLGNDFPALAGSGLRDWFARIHPEDRESVEAAVRNAIDTDAAFIPEYRFAKADGNWLWLHARGHVAERDAEGQALRIGHIGAQAVIGAMKIFKFDARLVLQLLHEVAMPVLPPGKGEQ